MFMNDLVDTFNRFMDLLFWGVGIVLLVGAFLIGGFVGTVIKFFLKGIGQGIPIYKSRSLTDLVLRGIVILAAVVLCFTVGIPFGEILSSVLPVGNFDELAQSFSNGGDQWVISNTISVAWNQLITTMISFLPFFLIGGVIELIEDFVCQPEDDSPYSYISYIPELLTLMASNVFLLFLGNRIPMMLLEFVNSIKVEYGLLRFLLLALVLFVYLYYVISDMFGSDIFLSMMGANIAAAILGVDLSGQMRVIMLILTIGLGYGSKLVRRFALKALTGEAEESRWWILSTLYGVIAMAVLALIFFGILKLMGC